MVSLYQNNSQGHSQWLYDWKILVAHVPSNGHHGVCLPVLFLYAAPDLLRDYHISSDLFEACVEDDRAQKDRRTQQAVVAMNANGPNPLA